MYFVVVVDDEYVLLKNVKRKISLHFHIINKYFSDNLFLSI